uniref:Uncharacterized protein n=1 Tax=Mola mola TaxID=94237 RepID=A0A3Q3X5J4_MOLML
MLFMVGMLLGSLFGGPISDRYGKRPVLLVCLCVHTVCGLMPAILPQPLVFLIVRCLTGMCSCCINVSSFSLVDETRGSALATMAVAPLAWLSPTWVTLHLSMGLPQLICLPFVLAVSALTYYGISMNIGSFGVDVYSAQFFSGLSETPCLLVPFVRTGRRPLSVLTLFLSGLSCLLSLLLSRYNSGPILVMSLALLGKLCMLAAIFTSVLYSIELFPTVVRQRCVSLVNLSFRLGCLVNSLVAPNPNGAIPLAAMVVFSSGPLIGCGLCLLLPETSGIPLPDLVEDCDKQPRPRLLSMDALWRGSQCSDLSGLFNPDKSKQNLDCCCSSTRNALYISQRSGSTLSCTLYHRALGATVLRSGSHCNLKKSIFKH